MLWELWRTSRADLLIRVGALSALIILIVLLVDLNATQIQILRGVVVLILALVSVFSHNWLNEFDNRRSGFSFRLGFTRPVSTPRLVIAPMFFTVASAMVCFVVPALVLRTLLDASFPLAGPAAGIACLIACLIAATWSASTPARKWIAILVLAGGALAVLVAFHARHNDPDPFVLAMGKPNYFQLAWYEYSLCFAVVGVAAAVTVAAVDRQRHGDAARPGGPAWSRFLSIPSRRPHRPFTSPFAAQCWYEMRRFGNTVLLLSVSAALLVFIAVSVLPRFYPGRESGPQIWLIALAVCPLAYPIIAIEGAIPLRRTQGATQLSAFDATRPMSNDQLICIKLLIIAACCLFGWLCMAAAAALHAGIAGDAQAWARMGRALSAGVGDVPAHWWLLGFCDALLLYVSSTSAVLAFGLWLPLHAKLFAWGIAVLYLHMFVGAWDAAHQWMLRPVWTAYGYAIAAAIVAGCLIALYKALRAGFLGKRFFAGALCLWIIYVSSTIALFSNARPPVPVPAVVTVLGAALLLVPLATAAFAPLTLAAHRHA
jgi:hypothetical protein